MWLYGEIETIKAVDGVQDVVLEAKYEPCVVEKEEVSTPNTATSSHMIGTPAAYAAGYTGTGSRVAIIDTGLDMDHQSFSAAGYEYSMALQAAKADMTLDNWMEHIGALTVQEIEKVLPLMNVKERVPNVTGADLYKNTKVPFGYNYIDNQSAYVDHDRDQQGGHGSPWWLALLPPTGIFTMQTARSARQFTPLVLWVWHRMHSL